MKSLKILLAGLVCFFTAQAASAVVITNAFMTDVEPANCDASLLDEVSTFYDTDKLVCFFASFEAAEPGDTYQTKWYSEGSLRIDGDNATVSSAGLTCMARIMRIKGTDVMELPGNWTVQLYYNGQLRVERGFEIQERCAARAALHDDAACLNALRTFRDQTLQKTRYGRKVIEVFYKYSPLLITSMKGNPVLKGGVRQLLKACAAVAEKFIELSH